MLVRLSLLSWSRLFLFLASLRRRSGIPAWRGSLPWPHRRLAEEVGALRPVRYSDVEGAKPATCSPESCTPRAARDRRNSKKVTFRRWRRTRRQEKEHKPFQGCTSCDAGIRPTMVMLLISTDSRPRVVPEASAAGQARVDRLVVWSSGQLDHHRAQHRGR